mmetsp:Transcript_13617/g.19844  ORF Transcript_13617/g.19844 Transcript_13617/m.19844 type:complete len:791 (+) Transcript_13617:139-2511(+)|eukprot:CAMPEP_0195525932 /NCGR_PEP_ID=MMETSP0794_2-20130614/26648_1 /TAXON_ID=515487 /ORGANISM="Stephanopyxis turris, Strain CCMP 815" /LENGTH=790 /DNA_ID=CAMNT_0040656503 /DNA_START=135 /DNA_END=2507 /DNA_ORIENTATION=+
MAMFKRSNDEEEYAKLSVDNSPTEECIDLPSIEFSHEECENDRVSSTNSNCIAIDNVNSNRISGLRPTQIDDLMATKQTARFKRRHRFVTNSAISMSVASLLLLGFLFFFSGGTSSSDSLSTRSIRNLDEMEGDFSSYSCDDLYANTDPNDRAEQCNYALTCNEGGGIFAPVVFCSQSSFSTKSLCLMLSPLLMLLLVILFRMLGSTAEDYFSPCLEMFSVKMGLPPRFAGVTLLALGNGAADVSGTINALKIDPIKGYQLALGALTGGAMFIGTVVAGLVILVADGVPCKGALVREVAVLILTVLVVYFEFASGKIGHIATTIFITLYVSFVVIVFIADVYHRRVVLPRLEEAREKRELRRQQEEAERLKEAAAADQSTELRLNFQKNGKQRSSVTILNESESTDVPIENSGFGKLMNALSNYGTKESQGLENGAGWGIQDEDGEERLMVFHGHRHRLANQDAITNANEPDVTSSPYRAMESDSLEIGDPCMDGGAFGFTAESWTGALIEGKDEMVQYWKDCWDDIFHNEENNKLDKFLLACELPMTVFRLVTIPIPCDGYYCRPLLALSVALSPLWFGIYFWVEYEINLFYDGGFPVIIFLFLLSGIVGSLILRFAPRGEGPMALLASIPIALFGFIIAATWIDTIADVLVNLLSFLGIICHIPSSIMGLTVLAWGNSMGDMAANMTMARKGLANMAITACFAGPVFNMLIGLGFGFNILANQTGQSEFEVGVPASAAGGFLFLTINCVLVIITGICINHGFIPKQHGYVTMGLYAAYVVVSLVLQFM